MYGGTNIGGINARVVGETGGFGGAVFVGGGKMTMYDGIIKDGKAVSMTDGESKIAGMGGNVFVHTKGNFEMIGGQIIGGQADNGEANVHVAEGGIFTHTGGIIG